MERWATFDCYGTIVDWNAGIAAALGDPGLLDRYHELEPVVQAEDPAMRYRDVLRETARRVGVDADPAASLPEWPVFPDARPALEEARSRGWSLAILTNSDRDLIEASMAAIDVPFELAIVASEIGSYKPGAPALALVRRCGRPSPGRPRRAEPLPRRRACHRTRHPDHLDQPPRRER